MKNILYRIGMFGVAALTLTSCLDEDPLFDPEKTTGIIEFVEQAPLVAVGSVYPLNKLTFEAVPADQIEVIVQYSGAYNAPEDLVVTVELSPSDLPTYNADQGLTGVDQYVMLDAGSYTLPGGGSTVSVTIPKGEKRVSFMIDVKPDKFKFDANYAIPLKISSASSGVVSGNFGHMIYAVIPNNQWAGDYDHTYSGSLGSGTNVVHMTTIGEFRTTSNLIGVYSNQTIIEIDPVNNYASVISVSGLGNATNYPENFWDPATKTIHVKYTVGSRTMTETYVKK
ncbi:DUF1735 domain-containing protein [Algoriphagus aquimarinus]|uniref:Uncharacterized protein n=1 Tax=Algoriphagus aquimarinus TaxID=237018 RepID=A0A1I1CEI2_9BACT|nr:DUF1735 domain-containing protein [Algoriphagus aquimarinus]SFB58863.1 protein of unknown function [Algoriphagus aquimarinus]